MYYLPQSSLKPFEADATPFTILQMRRLRLRELKQLAHLIGRIAGI